MNVMDYGIVGESQMKPNQRYLELYTSPGVYPR